MDNEEDAVYLEGVEKPELTNCKHADIQALGIHDSDKEEDKIPALFDVKKHPVFLLYPTIDEDMKITGFTAKVQLALSHKSKPKKKQ